MPITIYENSVIKQIVNSGASRLKCDKIAEITKDLMNKKDWQNMSEKKKDDVTLAMHSRRTDAYVQEEVGSGGLGGGVLEEGWWVEDNTPGEQW